MAQTAWINHPTLLSATPTGAGTSISYRLDAVSGRAYRVEFFSGAVPDPSGYGEGLTYLGSLNVTASSTPQTFSVTLPTVAVGAYVTATVTELAAAPMTSEFSAAVRVGPPPPAAEVRGRYVFYNNSAFDGRNPGVGAADDAAIATDKQPLLPGQSQTAANVDQLRQGD